MLKAKDKEARRGNLITFAIVLVLTLVTMVLENVMSPGSLLFTVIKKGAVYSLVAVSMNLLNGFTGLFSLGQAGFMLLGAYAYAIFMIPDAARDGVYYRGYEIDDLVAPLLREKRFGFEEIAYLLLSGNLPDKEELEAFRELINENMPLDHRTIEEVREEYLQKVYTIIDYL